MVRLDGVGLEFGQAGTTNRVLHGVSFSIAEGGFRWLLGPSGAGKTSLLRLLHLAVRPTEGRLTLLGQDISAAARSRLPVLRRRIGMVFQDFRLLPHLSAFDNVALPLRVAGRPEGQVRVDAVELPRVAIARAGGARPLLLLADEPTGNLDDPQAERLMQLLHEMNRLGTTVVVATHNAALVSRHPAHTLRLLDGRLVRDD